MPEAGRGTAVPGAGGKEIIGKGTAVTGAGAELPPEIVAAESLLRSLTPGMLFSSWGFALVLNILRLNIEYSFISN